MAFLYRDMLQYPIHKNANGDSRRSKNEIIIEQELQRHGLAYQYEKQLGNYKPDFTICYDGQTFYWEHLGCLENPEYYARWQRKLKFYTDQGIASSLIITKDQGGSIDVRDIVSAISKIKHGRKPESLDSPARADHIVSINQIRTLGMDNERLVIRPLKKEILVQHEFQETFPLGRSHVKALRQKWDQLAAGVIIVSFRGGQYRVLDGRHRWEAAPAGFEFNCHVMYNLSPEREAQLWRNYNIDRKSKSALTRHNNDVTAGDRIAVLIDDLVTSIGRQTKHRGGNSGNNVACVDVIRRMILKHGEELVSDVFPLIGDLTKGNALPTSLFAGTVDLQQRVRSCGASLTDHRWQKRILAVGYDRIMHSVKTRSNVNGGAGDRHWADAILYAINYGLHTNARLIAYGLNDC